MEINSNCFRQPYISIENILSLKAYNTTESSLFAIIAHRQELTINLIDKLNHFVRPCERTFNVICFFFLYGKWYCAPQ